MTISLPDLYTEVMFLAQRGYTVRTIRRKLEPKFPTLASANLPDAILTQWILEGHADLAEARLLEEKFTEENVGLARKKKRILKLAEHAEHLEEVAMKSPQWSGEYRRTIAEIDELCVGTTITFDISDGWAKLLREIANIGPAAFVEQRKLEPTEEDHRVIIDLTDSVTIPDSAERQAAKADIRRGT